MKILGNAVEIEAGDNRLPYGRWKRELHRLLDEIDRRKYRTRSGRQGEFTIGWLNEQ